MGNKGRVVVFLSLLMGAFLMLALTAFQIADIRIARAKAYMASRTAASDIKAGYNSYLFDHYHLLLFDTNYVGRGEAYGEEIMKKSIENNLQGAFDSCEVAIVDYDLVSEKSCQELKNQIEEIVPYLGVEYGAEQILNGTMHQDGTLSDELVYDMEQAQIEIQEQNTKSIDNTSDVNKRDEEETIVDFETEKDPREYTSGLSSVSILTIVAPEDISLWSGELIFENLPSKKYYGLDFNGFTANQKFDDYNNLKQDLNKRATWKYDLLAAGSGVVFARSCFNSVVKNDVNDTAILKLEQEYLICGKSTEQENFKGVVNELIGIRFPVNYSYLVSDSEKMREIATVATPISLATGVWEPILKYLLAGCWSYVESVCDVRNLVQGKRMAFQKNKENWITDFYDLANSVMDDGKEEETGLCYEDYLMILMSLNMEQVYYRMLDLMQINVNQSVELTEDSFCMKNAAGGLLADISITYKNKELKFQQYSTY